MWSISPLEWTISLHIILPAHAILYKYNPIYFPHNTIYNNHCNDQKSSIVFLHNSRTVTVSLDSPFITREDHGNIVVTVSLNTPNETNSTLVDVRTLDSSTTGKNCCLCIKHFFLLKMSSRIFQWNRPY